MEFELEKANSARVVNTEENYESSPGRKAKRKDKEVTIESELTEDDLKDLGTRKTLFFLFWLSTMFLNIDTGVIPTAQL